MSVYFADFETTTINTEYYKQHNDVKVWLWYIKSFDEKTDKMGIEIKDFINYCLNLNHKDIIYFHNLAFDGDFIVKHLEQIGYKPINSSDRAEDQTFSIFRKGKTIYYINVFNHNKMIKFQCSYQIMMSSIKDLESSVNLKKLNNSNEEFYDIEPCKTLEEVPQIYKDYIINDVLIALRSFKNFKQVVNTINP